MACVIIVGKRGVSRFCKLKCTCIHSKEVIKIYQAMCLFGMFTCECEAYARAHTHTHIHTHVYVVLVIL